MSSVVLESVVDDLCRGSFLNAMRWHGAQIFSVWVQLRAGVGFGDIWKKKAGVTDMTRMTIANILCAEPPAGLLCGWRASQKCSSAGSPLLECVKRGCLFQPEGNKYLLDSPGIVGQAH